ncbi:MAG: hypothetical protein FJZ43_02505 [Candidatus Staskawiczbacteria bacterium]|nr:hypothetical protein [Candidatus Staskawiczbacteria bacterium]
MISLKGLREKQARLRKDVTERTIGYILAAFSFVAGLAWNEAIKSMIDQLFPFSRDSIWIKFIYAIIITLVIVLVTIYLLKIIEKKEEVNT